LKLGLAARTQPLEEEEDDDDSPRRESHPAIENASGLHAKDEEDASTEDDATHEDAPSA